MEDKPVCPFCRAESTSSGGGTIGFSCETSSWIVGEWQGVPERRYYRRSTLCYERQIATLKGGKE